MKFLAVGAVNTGVDFGILNFLVQIAGWSVLWSNTVSFSTAVCTSYFLNKYWTFGNLNRAFGKQFPLFVLVSLLGLGLSNTLLHFGLPLATIHLTNLSFGWQYNIVKAISALIVLTWNFVAYKFLVFNERK